jgi:hypothetical protein
MYRKLGALLSTLRRLDREPVLKDPTSEKFGLKARWRIHCERRDRVPLYCYRMSAR